MKKEFGKWLMDIAKYMTTALLLSSVFSKMDNFWIYLVIMFSAALTLFLGLMLVRDKQKKGE